MPLADPGTTGNFEVFLNDNLVHSKKTGGKGKAESEEERAAIIASIEKIVA